MNRNFTVITSVVAIHIGVLWALNPGSIRRAVEVVIPIEILATTLPDQTSALAPPAVRTVDKPLIKPATKPQTPEIFALQAAPATIPESSAEAKTFRDAPIAASATPVAAEADNAPLTRQTAFKAETSTSEAQYLAKPEPPYPNLSVRLGEEGRALVRVLIGVDGLASQASIVHTSGFFRLDQASLAAVATWRFVPAKRNGVPEPMWFDIPINWTIKQ